MGKRIQICMFVAAIAIIGFFAVGLAIAKEKPKPEDPKEETTTTKSDSAPPEQKTRRAVRKTTRPPQPAAQLPSMELRQRGDRVYLLLEESVRNLEIYVGNRRLGKLGSGKSFDITPYLEKAEGKDLTFGQGRLRSRRFTGKEYTALLPAVKTRPGYEPKAAQSTTKLKPGFKPDAVKSTKPMAATTMRPFAGSGAPLEIAEITQRDGKLLVVLNNKGRLSPQDYRDGKLELSYGKQGLSWPLSQVGSMTAFARQGKIVFNTAIAVEQVARVQARFVNVSGIDPGTGVKRTMVTPQALAQPNTGATVQPLSKLEAGKAQTALQLGPKVVPDLSKLPSAPPPGQFLDSSADVSQMLIIASINPEVVPPGQSAAEFTLSGHFNPLTEPAIDSWSVKMRNSETTFALTTLDSGPNTVRCVTSGILPATTYKVYIEASASGQTYKSNEVDLRALHNCNIQTVHGFDTGKATRGLPVFIWGNSFGSGNDGYQVYIQHKTQGMQYPVDILEWDNNEIKAKLRDYIPEAEYDLWIFHASSGIENSDRVNLQIFEPTNGPADNPHHPPVINAVAHENGRGNDFYPGDTLVISGERFNNGSLQLRRGSSAYGFETLSQDNSQIVVQLNPTIEPDYTPYGYNFIMRWPCDNNYCNSDPKYITVVLPKIQFIGGSSGGPNNPIYQGDWIDVRLHFGYPGLDAITLVYATATDAVDNLGQELTGAYQLSNVQKLSNDRVIGKLPDHLGPGFYELGINYKVHGQQHEMEKKVFKIEPLYELNP